MNSHLVGFERDVMDRWDAGMGSRAIALELGRREELVAQVIGRYAGGEGGPEHERLTRFAQLAGNERYVAAVAATGRNFA